MKYQLAQINITTALAPMHTETMSGFVEGLERINRLAEESEGFVWRLKDEADDPTAVEAFPNPLTLVNMSVWENVESLKIYTFRTEHADFLRNRKKWFEKAKTPSYVLWWIPARTIPTVGEAKEILTLLKEKGATPEGFDFKCLFDPPNEV